jgi:hypothetical protein
MLGDESEKTIDETTKAISEMEMITASAVSSAAKDVKMVSKKPPLPPKPHTAKPELSSKIPKGNQMQWKTEEDNAQHVQKLMAVNEKLNTEIGNLRKQLHHERVAVRELR